MSEFELYGPIQIAASRAGARLFRNHVGMAWQVTSEAPKNWQPPKGFMRPVKIGLQTGSGDEIGWAPYVVREWDVGKTFAIFTSLEIKPPDWRETPKWSEGPQRQWLEVVRQAGGIAYVVQTPENVAAMLADGPRWAKGPE